MARALLEVRGVLESDRRIAVGQRLRRLEVLRTPRSRTCCAISAPTSWGQIGDAAEATRRLTASPEREVGEALVDQSVMAGPGNVYRSEVCFLAGIDPRTRVGAVPNPTELADLMRSLMERNRAGGKRQTTQNPRRGHELWIYGRRGRPCRRCGTPVRSYTQGPAGEERAAFACPNCQPPRAIPA
jgi:endonuclease VIII